MIPHFSDPEAPSLRGEAKLQRDAEFRAGQIGEITYLTSLRILGYALVDAKAEMNLIKLEKRR